MPGYQAKRPLGAGLKEPCIRTRTQRSPQSQKKPQIATPPKFNLASTVLPRRSQNYQNPLSFSYQPTHIQVPPEPQQRKAYSDVLRHGLSEPGTINQEPRQQPQVFSGAPEHIKQALQMLSNFFNL